MEYQQQFETLSNRIYGLPTDSLLNCFLSGLRADIQRELTVLRPYSLSDAIGLAKLIESKITGTEPVFSRPDATSRHSLRFCALSPFSCSFGWPTLTPHSPPSGIYSPAYCDYSYRFWEISLYSTTENY